MSSDIKDDIKSFEYDKDKLDTEYGDEKSNATAAFIKSAEEKAFLRKLNWKLLPVVFLIIFIQVKKNSYSTL